MHHDQRLFLDGGACYDRGTGSAHGALLHLVVLGLLMGLLLGLVGGLLGRLLRAGERTRVQRRAP
jgi:hypothetical protein